MNKPSTFQPISTSILQAYADGILLLTEDKKTIYSNETATQILTQSTSLEEIWAICQSFMLTSEQDAIEEFEVNVRSHSILRIRVRWLAFDQRKPSCLLVILIDEKQTAQNLAIAEAKQLGLTPCETKVYALYRANYSGAEIAKTLFISINTVKKHMRNIRQKRYAQDEE